MKTIFGIKCVEVRRRRDEAGASLILALIYITAISLIVVSLAGWVSNDLTNTTKFSNAAQFDSALRSVTELGIQNIRYYPGATWSTPAIPGPSYCWQPAGGGSMSSQTINGYSVAVWCSTVQNLASAQTRIVTLDACLSTVSEANCVASPSLQAKVAFDDYLPGNSPIASSTCTATCGSSAITQYWSFGTVTGGVPTPSTTTTVSGGTSSTTSTSTSTSTTSSTTTSTISYSVTFNANGGTGTMASETSGVATNLTANTFTRTGYTFNGWNTAANGVGGTPYADGASYPFTSSVILYAQWLANSYTVTFNANQGSGTMTTQTSSVPAALTTNTFTRSGYTFIGWNTVANGSGTPYADGASYPFTASTTLYAQWSNAPIGVSLTQTPTGGGGNGVPTNGDVVTFTFSQVMQASSIVSGWNGSSQNEYAVFTRPTSSSATQMDFCTSTSCNTAVNLGTVDLGDSTTSGFYQSVGSTTYLQIQISMSSAGNQSIVTVTIGSHPRRGAGPSLSGIDPSASTVLTWTPSTSATNSSGVACLSSPTVTESGGAQVNF